MPSEKKLNDFYKNVYRSKNRPPYWITEDYDDRKIFKKFIKFHQHKGL